MGDEEGHLRGESHLCGDRKGYEQQEQQLREKKVPDLSEQTL